MKYFITCLVCLFTFICNAQDCSLTFLGEVKDFHDGSPIFSANIYIKNTDRYVVSDFDGKFKIENLCKGDLTLVISHIGCETKTITYTLNSDVFKSIDIEHHIEALNEVVIKGETISKETSAAQETILKAKVLEKYSALSLGDALKEVSGVSSINTGNSIVKPMINGMHSSRILILNNNVRLQDQEWGIEHAPNIDINSADQISVIKGSGTLAYGGDAIGGIIVIKPSRPILKDTLFGKTIIGGQTNGRGYNISTKLNKNYKSGWYANMQASLKQNGDFEAPDYNLTNTGLKSKGLSFRLGKKIFESGFELFYSYLDNEIGILSASHIGNVNDLINAINSPEPAIIRDFSYDIKNPRQDVKHHLFKAKYFKRFKNFGKVNLQYDYQNNNRLEYDIRRGGGELSTDAALDLTLQTHTILADVNLDSNLDRKMNFGVLARYQDNYAPDTGFRRLIPNYEKYDFGTYFTTKWRLNNTLLIDAGLRYDFARVDAFKFYRRTRWEAQGYDVDFPEFEVPRDGISGANIFTNPVFDFHNISASVGIKYDLNSNSYLLSNYNLSSRPPNPAELFSDGLHHSAARIELGDLKLDSEISNRFSVTYNYEKNNFNLLIDAFYNVINDYMYLKPTGVIQSNRGAFPVWEYVQTNARLFGADLTLSYDFENRLNWLNKTSIIKGYDTNNTPLIDIPAINTTNSINYRNQNWYNFSASINHELTFEQNEFPDFNFTVNNPTTGEEELLDISTPPEAYSLFHFSSEATFNLTNKTNLNISLGINNIFNTSYRSYLNRLRYFADDLGRNITLQLKLNY